MRGGYCAGCVAGLARAGAEPPRSQRPAAPSPAPQPPPSRHRPGQGGPRVAQGPRPRLIGYVFGERTVLSDRRRPGRAWWVRAARRRHAVPAAPRCAPHLTFKRAPRRGVAASPSGLAVAPAGEVNENTPPAGVRTRGRVKGRGRGSMLKPLKGTRTGWTTRRSRRGAPPRGGSTACERGAEA